MPRKEDPLGREDQFRKATAVKAISFFDLSLFHAKCELIYVSKKSLVIFCWEVAGSNFLITEDAAVRTSAVHDKTGIIKGLLLVLDS